jgi:hypothetical protein
MKILIFLKNYPFILIAFNCLHFDVLGIFCKFLLGQLVFILFISL